MKSLFIGFLNVSLSGALLVCIVLLLRLVFKKAPKALTCALWGLAIMRLLLPFQIETSFSLCPEVPAFTVRDTELTMDVSPVPEAQIPDYIPHAELGNTKTVAVDYIAILSYVWAGVAVAMIAYMLISYISLKHRLRDAVCLEKGVYISRGLESAILLGYFKPKIYLSGSLGLPETELVIAHERMHQRRGDNWLKLFGFICLCLHWFNPLVWVAYAVLCRDIEDACDEMVVSKLDIEERKLYSSALLSCGKEKKSYIGCPVAFGEISVRQRILNVLNYRKPTLWISAAAVVAVLLTAIFFMTDPIRENLPYYDKMTSLMGEQLDIVCEELNIPKASGETPITVEYLGIPFKLYIYADEYRSDGEVYSFEYVADYNDNRVAARDIVTLARYHWRHYGEGLSAQRKRDPSILSYITEEDVIKQIERNQKRSSTSDIISDNWDITNIGGKQLKNYLEERKSDSSKLYITDQDGERLNYYEPFFDYSLVAYCDKNDIGDDMVRIVMRYGIDNKYDSVHKMFASYVEEQKWWDRFLNSLK